MIGETVSHYKILEKLGEGGMGVVYKAEDTKLERFVAIKVLPTHMTSDEDAQTRFVREARAASALEHPNICHIHEIGETPDGHLYMVMPCYEGETLRERIERGPLEIDEALDIITQVVSALSRAHEKGIVHRDIKPGNVMLTNDGRQATLLDFGLAKKLDATKVTRTGTAIGTVAYMSPEQSIGTEADQRTDIWSLGVVLYEMLTGRLPFEGEYEPAVIYSIMNEEPDPVTSVRREVPPGVEDVIEKALVKDATKRYQSATELLSDLEKQRDQLELGIKQRRFIKIRKKTRNRLLRIGLPAIVIAAVVFVLFVVQPFEFEIRPRTKEAIAQENSMAIMYFENMTDPADSAKTAGMITSLLTTGLGNSEYIRVLSEQRKYDILKQIGKSNEQVVDRTTASEVAKRAGAEWAMTGTVIQTEPNLVVAADIWHSETGEMMRMGVRKRFEADTDIFAAVDLLISEISTELSLPEEAMEGLGRSVSELLTTNSQEAYHFYIKGLDAYNHYSWYEAEEHFQRALEYDSTFGIAHYQLARTVWTIQLGAVTPEVKELARKAVQYSKQATRMERWFIEAWDERISGRDQEAIAILQRIVAHYPQEKEAWFFIGFNHHVFQAQFEEAIHNYKKAVGLDSLFTHGYQLIAFCYHWLGDYENAMWAINQCHVIEPDELVWIASRALLLAWNGKLEQAIELYQELDEEFFWADDWILRGGWYVFKKDYARAEESYKKVIMADTLYSSAERAVARRHLAHSLAYQGKLEASLLLLDELIAVDRLEDEMQEDDGKYGLKALIYMEQGKLDAAFDEVEHAIEFGDAGGIKARIESDMFVSEFIKDPLIWWGLSVYLHAQRGEITEAEDMIAMIKKEAEDRGTSLTENYWWAQGVVELAKSNPSAAVARFERAIEQVWTNGYMPEEKDAHITFFLAKAYMQSGKPDDGIAELEKLISTYYTDRLLFGLWTVRAHYLLAQAYEQLGRTDEARTQYKEFIEIWKDADPELQHEVTDARQRLAGLERL